MKITLPGTAEVLGISDDSLQNVHEEVVKLVAERDRLARILAVERGDTSQAPEGWFWGITGDWVCSRGETVEFVTAYSKNLWLLFNVSGKAVSRHPFALEAMEAADAALEEPGTNSNYVEVGESAPLDVDNFRASHETSHNANHNEGGQHG